MSTEEFEQHMKEFEIGWPLRIYDIKFELGEFEKDVYIKMEMNNLMPAAGPEAIPPGGFGLHTHRIINPARFKTEYQVWDELRSMLKWWLSHEADESIQIRDVRLYDPHAKEGEMRRILEAGYTQEAQEAARTRKYYDHG